MPPARNLSPWAQWMLRLERTTTADPCPVDDPPAVPAWRDRARARLHELLGPDPAPVPLALECTDTVDVGSYARHRVLFDAEDTMAVPAFLLVPHDRDRSGPAVLAVHGHGPGKAEVCGVDDDEASAAAIREDHGDYGHRLAEAGYVVLAPDLRLFGERTGFEVPGRYGCDLNLVHAYAAGYNPLAQNLWDLRRGLDVLAGHDRVDPERLGVVGFSYGATCALFLAALDDRVRAAVVSGYLCTWSASHRLPGNLCGSQVLPGMLGRLDHVDVGGLVAPRPLLVESGVEDLAFPADGAREVVAQLRAVYAALGAADDALDHDVFAGGHEWHGEHVPAFLGRSLGAPA
jgi:dienelactone hydrolase